MAPAAAVAVLAANLVVACSAAARAAGVRRGQRLRDAQRHCPDLMVRARDLDAEARAFEPVVAAVEEFCPRVEVVRPGLCAIGARGPARYFGGEKALAEKLTQALTDRGVTCRTGVADGMFAAQLAARTGSDGVVVPPGGTRRFLAPHSVGLLEDPELTGLLARLGIHTLGDFAALPAQDVLARFGAVGATAHRLARGLEPRTLAPRSPSADLSEAIEFDPPVLLAEPVVFAGRALADRLHTNLARRGLACVRVEVQVGFTSGQIYSRLWRHDGLLSSLAVAERVRWQLDGWRTGARVAGAGGARVAGEGLGGTRVAGEEGGTRVAGEEGGACMAGVHGVRMAGVAGVAGAGGASVAGVYGVRVVGEGPGGALVAGKHRGKPADERRTGGPPADDRADSSLAASNTGDDADDGVSRGGIVVLRLIPDQIVPDEGTQLGLWGEAMVSDRVARAASRVQSLLGHEAVTRPVLAGGRGPGEQITLVPFGDSRAPRLPADRPWPGRIPAPSPITVYPAPLPASVTCASGEPVTVTGRAAISAPPARLAIDGGLPQEITAWAGPWPVYEQWWDPAYVRRLARFQLVTRDGAAWLAAVEGGRWMIEASYD